MEIVKDVVKEIKDLLGITLLGGEKYTVTVGTVLMMIIGCIIAYYALRLIRSLVTSRLSKVDKRKFTSIFTFVHYIVYVIVIMVVLSSSGVDLTVLLTASAALFVGLGFALQYLFQDIISGILIILDQSLHQGDIIQINDKVVKIYEIRLRSTRGVTKNEKVMIIPNHKFLTENIFNFTQNSRLNREFVKVGVAYGSDVELVTKLLKESVSGVEGVLEKPGPIVFFEDFGDSALMFGLYFYTDDTFNEPRIKSDIRYKIDKLFRENKVTIPFPQRDVHLFQEK
ncbi:Mechanosensitive ion channel [Zhouia amylolytica]|uniref:Small-conductance mechanosensitive channel n=2 Tax=Zhouia amylolytica TaxID=376730 RepID=W2UM18_9FLAO|nr:mechanosensitive ion channel domain-containing protein [Zhouia amylolytica]ETN95205.1 small-conductance mechanosensitive channel [Zhouia amylolytica AD3]MCQ0111919.1 mechanosensitive ion channel [Zhouia amylolytica]SFS67702.1 Mechanosensitive ion channel [Zhouia amylolytica]